MLEGEGACHGRVDGIFGGAGLSVEEESAKADLRCEPGRGCRVVCVRGRLAGGRGGDYCRRGGGGGRGYWCWCGNCGCCGSRLGRGWEVVEVVIVDGLLGLGGYVS